MKRCISIILSTLCLFSGPVLAASDSMPLIRERLRFLVDLSVLRGKEKSRYENKIASLDAKAALEPIAHYLELIVPDALLEKQKTSSWSIVTREQELKSSLRQADPLRTGFTAFSTGFGAAAGLTVFGIGAVLDGNSSIKSYHGVAFAGLGALMGLMIGTVISGIGSIISNGFHWITVQGPLESEKRALAAATRHELVHHVYEHQKDILAPDQLVSFHQKYCSKSEKALEGTFKQGTLVKDLVSALVDAA